MNPDNAQGNGNDTDNPPEMSPKPFKDDNLTPTRFQYLGMWQTRPGLPVVYACIGARTRDKLQKHLTLSDVKPLTRSLAVGFLRQGAKSLYVRWGESGPNWAKPDLPPSDAEQVRQALEDLAEDQVIQPASGKQTRHVRYHRLIRWAAQGDKDDKGTVFMLRGATLRASYAKHLGGYDDNLTNAGPDNAQNMVDLGAELLYVSWSESGWVVSGTRPDNGDASGDGDDNDLYAHLGPDLDEDDEDDDNDDDWRPKTVTPENLDADRASATPDNDKV